MCARAYQRVIPSVVPARCLAALHQHERPLVKYILPIIDIHNVYDLQNICVDPLYYVIHFTLVTLPTTPKLNTPLARKIPIKTAKGARATNKKEHAPLRVRLLEPNDAAHIIC